MTDKTIPEGLGMQVFLANEQRKASLLARTRLRRWVTPCTIGAFLLSAVTGILLFFKVHLGMIKPVHEWLSWLFIIAALLHLFVNWEAGLKSVTRIGGRAILAVFILLLGLTFLPLGGSARHQRPDVLVGALLQASLDTVARLAQHNSDDMVVMFLAQGINVESKDQTLEQIAVRNNRQARELLGMIFY